MNVFRNSALTLFVLSLFLPVGGAGQVEQEKGVAIVECVRRANVTPAPRTLHSDEKRIYLGTLSGNILALDQQGLAIEWRAELGGEVVSSIVSNGSHLFVVNEPAERAEQERTVSTIRSIRKETGVVDWSAELPFPGPVLLVISNGAIFAADDSGNVIAIDEKTGGFLRQIKIDSRMTIAAGSPTNGLVAGSKGKNLHIISSNGAASLLVTEFAPTAILKKKDDGLIVGDERGGVTQFDRNGKDRDWRFRTGGQVSALYEIEEGVLLTSYDNFVYLVSDYNGDVIWKKRFNGRLNGSGLLMNGQFIIGDPTEATVFALDLKTGKVLDSAFVGDDALFSGGIVAAGKGRFAVLLRNGVKLYSLGGCDSK